MMIYHNPSAGTGAVSKADHMAAFREEGSRTDYLEKGEKRDGCPADHPILIAAGDGTLKRALGLFGDTGRRFAILRRRQHSA
jgi:hypothetical protein